MPKQLRATAVVAVLLAGMIAGMIAGAGIAAASDQPPACFGVPATLIVTPGVPTIGTEGADVIVGTDGADNIVGGGGRDRICGLDGNDVLHGGLGDDRIDGAAGNDHIVGDSATRTGDASGAGDDVLLGGHGVDSLVGDSEAPRNVGGSGGDDVLDLGPDGGFYAIGDHNVSDPEGGHAIGSGDDRLYGGTANDTLVGDSSVVDSSTTTAGDDVLISRGGHDWMFGDNTDYNAVETVGTAGGNDRFDGGDGIDLADAGPGNDIATGGPEWDLLLGGPGNDVLRGDDGDDILIGGLGDDILNGGAGTEDTCWGEAGHNIEIQCDFDPDEPPALESAGLRHNRPPAPR